ncbi:MAG: hypothetical protein ABI689_09460 [Thermoanaerobaculia bacterium]
MSARPGGFPAVLRPLLTVVLGLLAASVAFAQAAPDAFYLALLRDGKAEMLRGDALAAKKSFRLASFGFLEHPVLLAEGLVRLGLAESALNDQEEFVATFTRLAEVEERFAAYAPAALSADERRAFEEKALQWVTPEVLRSLPSFAPLLARKTEVDFAKLAPRERTRELEKRSAAEPENPRWKVLLARDEAAAERWPKALARLEGVSDSAEEGTAGCLRGQALARLKRCEEAVVALGACASASADALLAEAQLTCLVTLERADAARAFAAQLVRPATEAPAVRKAIARIPQPPAVKPVVPAPAGVQEEKRPVKEEKRPAKEKAPAPVKTAAPAATSAKPVAPALGPSSPAAATKNESRLTTEDERNLAEARRMLKTVENRDELRRGVALIQPVADRLPERADLQLLAGEIAYRAGLWTTGADYFRRSTPGGKGPSEPTLRFYYAVCLYEAGDLAAAAEVASAGLEQLQRPPFVESYLQKIRAARP